VQQHPGAEQAGLDLLAPAGARPGVEGGEDADGGDPPPGSVMTSSLAGIPTATTVPAARAMSKACTMSSGRPTTSKVTSAPRPSVNARTASTGSASAGSTAWVAPTRRLASRRPAAGSTARMVAAPAMRAPWTTDWPTPPQPITATLAPGCTPAVLRAAPSPVVTPQPSRASCSSGRSVVTGTIDASSTTMASAKVPHPHTAVAVRPSGRAKRVAARTAGPSSQWLDRPFTHHQQLPQAGDTEASTRSPTAARRTSAPTASTIPHPSWPGTIGRGRLDSPWITVRSV
jgi:hypothetical protein